MKMALKEREFLPNYDKNSHIFKVVSGAGKHSKGNRGVLKYAVEKYLKDTEYDYCFIEDRGVHLIRF